MQYSVIIYKTVRFLLYAVFTVFLLVGLHFLRRIYIADQFVIPTDSMTPTLIPGDRVVVNKLIFGARIYEDLDFSAGKELKSYRTRGLRKIKHNDIVVFNIPKHGGKIEFKINKLYAKRCVAVSGDTLRIEGGFFKNNNYSGLIGHKGQQEQLANTQESSLPNVIKNTLPYDPQNNAWTIQEFGPLYIPRKGDVIGIDSINFKLYKLVIEYETGQKLRLKGRRHVMLGKDPITRYLFKNNYYFMCGDYVLNSGDSRYWGFVPEEFIIGVVTHITYSKDKHDGSYRWERFGRKLLISNLLENE